MREPTFLIMTALAGPPLHGYGVMQQVTALSDGRVQLSAGTLYTALDRLAAEGLIEVDREEAVDGRVRRYYRLTDKGRRELGAVISSARMDSRFLPLLGWARGPAT